MVKAYVGEGEFTDDPFAMDGGIAVTRVARLRPLLGFIARNGFERHVAMAPGRNAEAVHGAITRCLNWPIYRHEAEPARDAFEVAGLSTVTGRRPFEFSGDEKIQCQAPT